MSLDVGCERIFLIDLIVSQILVAMARREFLTIVNHMIATAKDSIFSNTTNSVDSSTSFSMSSFDII